MRLLVKANAGATRLALGSGGAAGIALRPLMPSVDAARTAGLGLGEAAPAWHVTEEIDAATNPWDACHRLMRQGLGIGAGGEVALAEPDLEQPWLEPGQEGLGVAGDPGCGAASPQSQKYPRKEPGDWFAGEAFSGLAAARRIVGEGAPTVRLAHLDTGYDPDHRTKPRRLLEARGLNFADPDVQGRPTPGAKDQKTGGINPMFGHGTATLALLAGQGYGGASGFEVVPLRVANWVVLFRNSAIAAALDHVHALSRDPQTRCDVLSMSMGGLASAAWADAVNALYDAGVTLVTAAGNNFGNLPVRSIVYPARFNRVLAACGVMADGRPYADLPIDQMAGCYGPERKMRTALSAWTPNVPWARFGCPDQVDGDGGGTSSATPQIAAAAALWLHHHRDALRGHAGWQRVEAVRDALFRAVDRPGQVPDERLGRGILHADRALGMVPAPPASLQREKEDSTSFALLRLLTGIGVAPVPGQRMLELEALQISQRSAEVAREMQGYDAADRRLADSAWRRVLAAVAEAPGCSDTLKATIRDRLAATQEPENRTTLAPPAGPTWAMLPEPPVPVPSCRRLQVFAFDPSFASRMSTRHIATTAVEVPWEAKLLPGPVGEYLEVVDVDPASQRAYAPVDLNMPEILAQGGLPPSEGSPQFHQQMVYAVASRTIAHFRTALGRVPLWAERVVGGKGVPYTRSFVRRLRIYPHALRQANAFYSPDSCALLFGYFRAKAPGTTDVLKGGMIFTCLSHDIIAHETTHALLDGLHPRWKEPTNRDALAFHEAFSDLVALFQHFTLPDALLSEIRRARGQLRFGQILGGLARQFGEAIGGHGALRDAIGRRPDPADYETASGPHDRGAVLVAAVFDAWLQVYEDRTADLFRLASSGTGILPAGEIPHELAGRLAEEAAKLAGHFLNICIRALDYCPPVDLTFGEYLRAMITADADLVHDDPRGYRVALVDGFRKRGIMPKGVQTWSPEAMTWEKLDGASELASTGLGDPMQELKDKLGELAGHWRIDSDRLAAWKASRRDAGELHEVLMKPGLQALRAALGLLEPGPQQPPGGSPGTAKGIEVHSVRPLRRVGPDGQVFAGVVVEITQSWLPDGEQGVRGGCTIIWDQSARQMRYVIFKRVGHAARTEAQQTFRLAMSEGGARGNYFSPDPRQREPFALLHTHE